MSDYKLKELDLITYPDGKQYRILSIFDGNIFACAMGSAHVNAIYFSESDLNDQLKKGECAGEHLKPVIFDFEKFFSSMDEEKRIVSENRFNILRDTCRQLYLENKYSLYKLSQRGTAKPKVEKCCNALGITRTAFWKRFSQYLQSGLQEYVLLDKRALKKSYSKVSDTAESVGHKSRDGSDPYKCTSRDYKIFNKYLNSYLTHEVKSIVNAYSDMIDDKYSTIVKTADKNGNLVSVRIILPAGQRPSIRQFRYYVLSHTNMEQREIAKKTERIVRNNERVHTGTVMSGVDGPCHYVEMDAQEMDIALVSSEYNDIPVGRPIIYVIIDVMSEIILGVSLAMDNNSIVGCTNCFINLVEDKEKLFQKYGITFSPENGYTIDDLWPTGYKPRVVKFDNGSDFISKPVSRILSELNIRKENVPAATGSLKPLVENFFGSVKRGLDDLLEHKGLIRQTYNSNHHKEACLTFNDAYCIVLNEVIYHNSHVLSSYMKSADQKEKGIIASPMNLWKYGMNNMVPAERFLSRDDALYHILLPCKDAKITKNGIIRKGMPYFNPEDEVLREKMFAQGSKREAFECRYDPRDMAHLYYLRDGELMAVALPKDDYRYRSYYYMSEKRFNELNEMDKANNAMTEEINMQARINKRRSQKEVIDSAAKNHTGKNKVRNMREARKEEKEIISGDKSVSQIFDIHPESILQDTSDNLNATITDESEVSENKSVDVIDSKDLTPEEKRRLLIKQASDMDEDDM